MKNGNGTDAGSESRSKIYFDYAEQQGGKDDKVGLKRKTENGEQKTKYIKKQPKRGIRFQFYKM